MKMYQNERAFRAIQHLLYLVFIFIELNAHKIRLSNDLFVKSINFI